MNQQFDDLCDELDECYKRVEQLRARIEQLENDKRELEAMLRIKGYESGIKERDCGCS